MTRVSSSVASFIIEAVHSAKQIIGLVATLWSCTRLEVSSGKNLCHLHAKMNIEQWPSILGTDLVVPFSQFSPCEKPWQKQQREVKLLWCIWNCIGRVSSQGTYFPWTTPKEKAWQELNSLPLRRQWSICFEHCVLSWIEHSSAMTLDGQFGRQHCLRCLFCRWWWRKKLTEMSLQSGKHSCKVRVNFIRSDCTNFSAFRKSKLLSDLSSKGNKNTDIRNWHFYCSNIETVFTSHCDIASVSFADSQHALELLERIQERLKGGEELAPDEDLSNLIYLLDSPLFMQLINVQDSVTQLKQVKQNGKKRFVVFFCLWKCVKCANVCHLLLPCTAELSVKSGMTFRCVIQMQYLSDSRDCWTFHWQRIVQCVENADTSVSNLLDPDSS